MHGLLRRHVELFNAGVRSGDFGPMVDQFTDDAELVFEGVPAGPFRSREAIAAAYRERPPDDEIEVFGEREGRGEIVTDYAWRQEPSIRAGEMRIRPAVGDRIQRLIVTFAPRPRDAAGAE